MYCCRYRLTSWHVVISEWEAKDSVQLSNCQRYDQQHNEGKNKKIKKKELPLPSFYKWVDTGCPRKKKKNEIFERNSPFSEHPLTMKSYPVKRLTARHPLKGKLIQKGAVTCLSLFDCFLPPASTRNPRPPTVFAPWQIHPKFNYFSRRAAQKKWAALSQHSWAPPLELGPPSEECISFSHLLASDF